MLQLVTVDFENSKHASTVINLLDGYALDPMGGGQGLSEYTKQHLVEKLAKRVDVLSILAYIDETPVGLITCFEGFSTFQCKPLLNIHDLVVHPDFRGQGLATQLLKRVEQLAIVRGCCKLTLEVLLGNETAHSVYLKAGFSGYQLDPTLGNAVFLEKILGEKQQ
ncbi:MAG TPA: GNAT family N-acetyltransferase [Methylococcaceae bacterium]|jgi:GNAT superfamily N-acetyltransferase|nr:GNAT family N-acetyltransferase [Methylococcaceae bacterium]HIN69259.1 GNAT family N-acetyltransferase [Methylococcales bacterium]HIA46306.1 GNAT family N-acetyltransferase [Methylococcaceae bacterium]HIB61863.1 GNAT family N-acetyltransferase [Methylococcaceae bacterium]HIO12282.1 GNAT family N-acetyltransferase [Methylococcales bacterium]